MVGGALANFPVIFSVPFSGGSSVEGNFSAPVGGFSVDFMNMNQIIKFRPEEFVAPTPTSGRAGVLIPRHIFFAAWTFQCNPACHGYK